MTTHIKVRTGVLGANNANNDYDSTNVVANRDGSLIERSEYIIGLLDGTNARWAFSSSGPVEENAHQRFNMVIFDVNSGSVAVGDIDITGITAVMAKSTGGGAFSAVGITQPTFSKGNGIVYCDYQFLAGEWAVGDMYRLMVNGVTATVDGATVYIPDASWSNVVLEAATVDTNVETLLTSVGDPSGDTLTSLTAKVGDLARSLATLLGTRWDLAGDLGSDIGTIDGKLDTIDDYLDAEVAAIQAKTDLLPADPASESAVTTAISTSEGNIRGADSDTLKTLSDQLDGVSGSGTIRVAQAGAKAIASAGSKYLSFDSGTNGAEILGIVVKGIVGSAWTVDGYIPAADGATVKQAEDKRFSYTYLVTDTEGGAFDAQGIPFDLVLNFTNNGVGEQTITEVTFVYRSAAAIVPAWEA